MASQDSRNIHRFRIPAVILTSRCYGGKDNVNYCDWFSSPSCPETCKFSDEFKKADIPTGLERFRKKYGTDWRASQ